MSRYRSVSSALTSTSGRARFITPRPYAYNDCSTSSPPAQINVSLLAPLPDPYIAVHVDVDDFHGISLPAMILDQIPDLPPALTSTYRRLFWRDELARSGPPIRLLRLYLGRVLPPTSHHLAPGVQSDFPLDQPRYRLLDEALREEGRAGLPDSSEVCRGMGEVLGKLHWTAGTNGRDVELVLGGDEQDGVQCEILDYNQVSSSPAALSTS